MNIVWHCIMLFSISFIILLLQFGSPVDGVNIKTCTPKSELMNDYETLPAVSPDHFLVCLFFILTRQGLTQILVLLFHSFLCLTSSVALPQTKLRFNYELNIIYHRV